jgi:hypothetical protein
MVKYWRKNAIKIDLYLDDGFGMPDSFEECQKDSFFVKQYLVDAGFFINEEKSIFVPTQKLEWLGILCVYRSRIGSGNGQGHFIVTCNRESH